MFEGSVELLSKVTKKDYTSVVSIVVGYKGIAYVVPKSEIGRLSFTNARFSCNGALYPSTRLCGPISEEMFHAIWAEGMRSEDFLRKVRALGR